MLAAQVVYHPHLHLHPCLVHGLDVLVFALTWQRLHVSSGDQVAHATWSLAETQDSSAKCPILECSAGEEYRPKAGHVILSHFGSSSIVVPKFFIWERKQDGHLTCLKNINFGRTRWNCWKVNNATFLAGFCLGVGQHEKFVSTAEFLVMP